MSWDLENSHVKSPFMRLAEDLDRDLVRVLIDFEGLRKFKATDQHGHGKILGAKFPSTFAAFVEQLAESKNLGFGSKSNYIRAAVYLLTAVITTWRDEDYISKGIKQYLASDLLAVEQAYRQEAIERIDQIVQDLRDVSLPDNERALAESVLKEFSTSGNSKVSDAAEVALRLV